MPKLDIERIVNGTLNKRLSNAYSNMQKNGLTEESASAYKDLYKDEPLSEILNESELIFKEPIEGLKFYESVMTNEKLPLYRYAGEYEKITDFYESVKDRMPAEQKSLYENAIENIKSVIESRQNEIGFAYCGLDDESRVVIESTCDKLYKDRELDYNIFESVSLPQKILYSLYILPNVNNSKLYSILRESMMFKESYLGDKDKYESVVKSNVYASYLMEDAAITNAFEDVNMFSLQRLYVEACTEDYGRVYEELFTERVYDYDPSYISGEESVMRIFDDDSFYEVTKSDNLDTKIANSARARFIMEAFSDVVGTRMETSGGDPMVESRTILESFGLDTPVPSSVIDDFLTKRIDSLSEAIYEATVESKEYFFEFTRRGEVTKAIKDNVGALREGPNDNKKPQDSSEGDDDEEESLDDNKKPSKKQNDGSNDIDNEPNVETPTPDGTITKKIQNKAMDIDAQFQKGKAKADNAFTDVKNAAKAVARVPSQILSGIQSKIKAIGEFDDEFKKKMMLEPGYRNQVFAFIRKVLKYGVLWHIKWTYGLIAFIWDKTPIAKSKNTRLRNELVMEIDSELKIVDEKISDAQNNGDQQQKYQLMRIKAKLEAEKIRVAANAKTI